MIVLPAVVAIDVVAVVVVAVLEDCLDPGVSFALMRKLIGLRPYAPGKYFEVFKREML